MWALERGAGKALVAAMRTVMALAALAMAAAGASVKRYALGVLQVGEVFEQQLSRSDVVRYVEWKGPRGEVELSADGKKDEVLRATQGGHGFLKVEAGGNVTVKVRAKNKIDGESQLSVVSSENGLTGAGCGGFKVVNDAELVRTCSGQGACENDLCSCNGNFVGRFCESPIKNLTDTVELELGPEDEWFYRLNELGEGGRLKVTGKATGVGAANVTVHAKIAGRDEGCGRPKKVKLPDVPSLYDVKALATPFPDGNVVLVRENDVKKNEYWVLRVAREKMPDSSEVGLAKVQLKASLCGKERGPCPSEKAKETEVCPVEQRKRPLGGGVPFMVLPICMGALGFVAATLTLLVWMDRRHGLISGADRLSVRELDRMYPVFKLGPGSGDGSAPSLAGAEASVPSLADVRASAPDGCSICLEDFQEATVLRKLQCAHVFHAECLDPWLTQSKASCPTCRADARLPELSDPHRMRSCIAACLSPVTWWRCRPRGTEENAEEPLPVRVPQPDIP